MMDEVRDNGGSIHVNEMEEMLGIPVIPISAAKNQGIQELDVYKRQDNVVKTGI